MSLVNDRPESVDNPHVDVFVASPVPGVLATSAAITATGNIPLAANYTASGCKVIVDITAASGTSPTYVGKLQFQDQASQKWIDVAGAVTASLTGVTTVTLDVFPGAPVTANVSANGRLPHFLRWVETIGGTTPSFTRTVGIEYYN